MTKRIPCRVIKSAVFNEGSDALAHVGQLVNKLFHDDDSPDIYAGGRYLNGCFTYTRKSDICRLSIDGSSTGRILDFRV